MVSVALYASKHLVVTTSAVVHGIQKDNTKGTGKNSEKLNGRNNLPTLSRGETVITHD